MNCFFVLLYFCLATSDSIVATEDWRQFRGPYSNGHGDAKNLPVEFGEDKNLKWKTGIDGRAWSSPIVVDNQVWLTNAVAKEMSEDERKKLKTDQQMQGLSAYSHVSLSAICFDLQTGEKKFEIELFDISNPPPINSLNSFASPTPITDGTFIYISFGSFGTVCLDRQDGSVRWKHDKYQVVHETGPGTSPILYEDLLIIHFDGTDRQFVVALDKESGDERWLTKRTGELHERNSMQKAFATPLVAKINGKDQLISPGADWVYGYEPLTGKELWKIKFGELGFSNAPQPVVFEEMIYVCTGFMRSQLLAIDASNGKPDESSIAWRYKTQVPCMPTPIIVDDRIYFVSDSGIASCLDRKTGDLIWNVRLGGGFSSSPIYSDGKLYFSNREGEVFVVKPGDTYELVATNQLDNRIMATPVTVGETLLIRTESSLYCFEAN